MDCKNLICCREIQIAITEELITIISVIYEVSNEQKIF